MPMVKWSDLDTEGTIEGTRVETEIKREYEQYQPKNNLNPNKYGEEMVEKNTEEGKHQRKGKKLRCQKVRDNDESERRKEERTVTRR